MKTLKEINDELALLEMKYAVCKTQRKKGRADLRLKAQVLYWVIGRPWEKHHSKFQG